jgi:hypothetical protein
MIFRSENLNLELNENASLILSPTGHYYFNAI